MKEFKIGEKVSVKSGSIGIEAMDGKYYINISGTPDFDGELKLIGLNMYSECVKASEVSPYIEKPTELKFGVPCQVRDSLFGKWIPAIYLGKRIKLETIYKHTVFFPNTNESDVFQYCELIPEEPTIKIKVKIDGKKATLKDISENELLSIRNNS